MHFAGSSSQGHQGRCDDARYTPMKTKLLAPPSAAPATLTGVADIPTGVGPHRMGSHSFPARQRCARKAYGEAMGRAEALQVRLVCGRVSLHG